MILKPNACWFATKRSAPWTSPSKARIVLLLQELKTRAPDLHPFFISHNLAVVQQLCDRVLVLYLGRMMDWRAPPKPCTANQPLHPGPARPVLVPDPDIQAARLASVFFFFFFFFFLARCPHLRRAAPSPLRPRRAAFCRPALPARPRRSLPGPDARPGSPQAPTGRVACHRWRELWRAPAAHSDTARAATRRRRRQKPRPLPPATQLTAPARAPPLFFQQNRACSCAPPSRIGYPPAPMQTEPTLRPSDSLRNVRYEIRGKLAHRAHWMERQGYEIISLNIGNRPPSVSVRRRPCV